MPGLSTQIAAAREQRGITVADAARRLHLRAEFIQAMDSGDWRKLGPAIYARGFIRNYARLVGIEPAVIGAQLDEAIPIEAPPAVVPMLAEEPNGVEVSAPVAVAPRAERDTLRSSLYPWLLGVMTALAAVLVIAVLYYTFGPQPRDQAQVATAGQAQPVSASPAPQDAAIFNGGAGIAQPAVQKDGVNLQVQLTQNSWLSVTVDGKRVVYETLPAGTVRDFHGVREITLRAGNAGGVNATIDGKPLGTLGQPGQVQELVFAAKPATQSSSGPRE